MVIDEYICLFGLKLKDLLECNGYNVDDCYLINCE